MFQTLSAPLLAALSVMASACSEPPNLVERNGAAGQPVSAKVENGMNSNGVPVNKRFATLEAYLAWLRQTQAPVDGSWYEEVRPGLYQLHTGNLRVLTPEGEAAPGKQTFTREELARQFGFSN